MDMGIGQKIRQAGESDREALERLVTEAFMDDPVSTWVFPDTEQRRAMNAPFFGVFIDTAFSEGRIDILEDGSAAALWLQIPAGEPDGDDDTGARMRAATDPDNERTEIIPRLTDAVHPHDRAHEYLLLIAVSPEHQGKGLGRALVAPVLERCDREGIPAYLEASSERSSRLYERLGFAFTQKPIELPDGPQMWPMWREPQGG
ncbi:GNAT family N-acetyltransferase [Streptomyces sp. NPDC088725]|uniref:GNAT family N-acetyltransferase n=1 Tax=Streptomyces sp. NPDC088725 TaxID=3365873 RepID=UPI00381AF800